MGRLGLGEWGKVLKECGFPDKSFQALHLRNVFLGFKFYKHTSQAGCDLLCMFATYIVCDNLGWLGRTGPVQVQLA